MKKNRRNTKRNFALLQKTGSVLLQIARLLVGGVFIFSGFVKAIDPYGFTYKIQDYLEAFGPFFQSFSGLAFTAAIALSTLELVLGLNLFFKIHYKASAFLTFLFLLVMTPLTLYLALKNPVSDCGCFGEALIITNWQTFFKNIVLITIVILLMIFNKNNRKLFLPRIEWSILMFFVAVGVGLSVTSYRHLPMIDFLPYKVGANIPNGMLIPEDAPHDEYKTTFIYKKNGQEKEFTLENYPKGDSTWVFVDQKSVLLSKGYVPPIHDLTMINDKLEDITQDVLYNTGYTYLLTMYDLSKTSEEGAKKAEIIYQRALKNATPFYALTSSSDSMIKEFKKKTGVTFPFCKTDPTTLKTMIRANPGLLLIKNGTVEGKWNWRDFLDE